jgi:hypothetical protein
MRHLEDRMQRRGVTYTAGLLAAFLSCATHRPYCSVYILSGSLHSSLDSYISFTLPWQFSAESMKFQNFRLGLWVIGGCDRVKGPTVLPYAKAFYGWNSVLFTPFGGQTRVLAGTAFQNYRYYWLCTRQKSTKFLKLALGLWGIGGCDWLPRTNFNPLSRGFLWLVYGWYSLSFAPFGGQSE